MKRIIFVLFCIILSATSSAQDSRLIKGMVMDTNEMPLSGVTIKGVHSDAITVSKQNGLFEIKVSPYTKHIEASFNGYLPANAEIDGSYIVFKLKIDKDFAKKEAAAKEEAKRIAEKEAAVKAKAEKEARLAAEREAATKAKAEKEARQAIESKEETTQETTTEETGIFFAWGETTYKKRYDKSNCKTFSKKIETISGNKQYDIACLCWSCGWHTPTLKDFKELIEHCSWTWVQLNGVNGYKVTGRNGNSIFLPANGYYNGAELYEKGNGGYYWSASPDKDYTQNAYYLYFSYDYYSTAWSSRSIGRCIRPVTK